MPTDHRADLKKIRTFPALVRYLRDEMGWPIALDSFEDADELFYDFTAEELGIDTASAAKIQEIKRLRPLSPNQPWGIFFVKFEPKKLPVVVLRRILSRVALKKRASANSDERAAWAADDLLFISNFGEGDGRQISLAHFSQHGDKTDLPTLKVLGWDNLDTPLHLDHIADVLRERLVWPGDEDDVAHWRESWRSAFTLRHREVITTSKTLAVRLAELARAIRDRIRTVLAIETESGPITKLMKAFREALVHDLDADGFADMYAQTIAYGLLSARVANPNANTADGFAAQLPVTNPFLKDLMETFLHVNGRKGKAGRGSGIDFDELGVSEVVELLDDANMEAVVRDFGDRNPQEDPVIHFYELFLKEYDAKKRMQRGVFYTPRPVVSYIVRSVHELLQTEFDLSDGLADTATWGEMAQRHKGLTIPDRVQTTDRFVTILDPATGTGTFLVEAIEVIHRTLVEKWKREGHGEKKILDLWNDYVPAHLLPRLHGYELLMAPYAIAHLKIGLKLHETGYRFGSDERARIYLTNALEPAHDFSGQFEFAIPALAHEAQAVNAVKQAQRFTVVIGNPPYAGFSSNMNPWIDGLLHGRDADGTQTTSYYEVDGVPLDERKLWLQDDYIKFIRLSQYLIERSGTGIHGLITNNSFLDGPTHRGLRFQLMRSFTLVSILNLHGSLKRHQDTADIERDENVFDIQQGVAVGVYVRGVNRIGGSQVKYRELRGKRTDKYERLLTRAVEQTTPLNPSGPWFLFVPTTASDVSEYFEQLSVRDIFRIKSTSVQTSRDDFVVSISRSELDDRIALLGGGSPDKLFRDDYGLKDGRNWKLVSARRDIRSSGNWRNSIRKYLYRAFDVRNILYRDSLINWPRHEVMDHLDLGNIALLLPRQLAGQEFRHVFCTRLICDMCVVSTATKEAVQAHPLFLGSDISMQSSLPGGTEANFSEGFKCEVKQRLGITCNDKTDIEACFRYIYAVLHSPRYRTRYAEFLKIDFPRLPLTSSLELFRELARIGAELVALHLVEAPVQQALSARYDKAGKIWRYDVAKGQRPPVTLSFHGPEKPIVGKVGWSNNTVWIDAVKPKKGEAGTMVTGTVGFRGVPEDVWNFHIGGYQVCEKWLKDRKDRTLTADDIAHYHRIVIALHETIRLMKEIDEVIDAHGGWPGAFQTADAKKEVATPLPFRPRIVHPRPEERYVTSAPLVLLKAAAGAFSDPQHVEDDGWEWVTIETRHRLRPGMFVAQVVGKSMEPAIPNGSWCLFASPVTGTRQGKAVLVQLRDSADPETGERYTVKRYESEKAEDGDGWRHTKITLRPINPDFQPITLTGEEEDRLQVIAEFIEVLQ
ncbi:MAG: hypothetical protein AUK27_04180 [Deltaproteobacteria bacterium CG2_30_66_27]|nr:MAG: hypothetical protein AUK27_04180 [Deltaproteobacteria bacterium CG2_30_66_27]